MVADVDEVEAAEAQVAADAELARELAAADEKAAAQQEKLETKAAVAAVAAFEARQDGRPTADVEMPAPPVPPLPPLPSSGSMSRGPHQMRPHRPAPAQPPSLDAVMRELPPDRVGQLGEPIVKLLDRPQVLAQLAARGWRGEAEVQGVPALRTALLDLIRSERRHLLAQLAQRGWLEDVTAQGVPALRAALSALIASERRHPHLVFTAIESARASEAQVRRPKSQSWSHRAAASIP